MPLAKLDPAPILASLALALKLTVSGNLLVWVGIPYSIEGGMLYGKVHPGTYVAILAMLARFASGNALLRPSLNAFGEPAGLLLYLAAILFCIIYAAMLTGAGGLIPLIDTFLPAGLIGVALQNASANFLEALRRLLRTLFFLNALLALGEAAVGANLIPLPGFGTETSPLVVGMTDEFRATALYDHPLTAATATMLGLMLRSGVRSYRLSSAIYDIIMFAALLAFGGRIALAVFIGVCVATDGARMGRALLKYRSTCRAWIPVVTVPLLCTLPCIGILSTGMAERLQSHMYWDISAQARVDQFQIVKLFTWNQIFLGCRRADFLALVEPLRLGYGVVTIENFWLLVAATLGVLCFPVFLCAMAALSRYLWSIGDTQGRLMVVALLTVASTSNSLGRKSMLLMLLVGCVAASGGRQADRSKNSAICHQVKVPF